MCYIFVVVVFDVCVVCVVDVVVVSVLCIVLMVCSSCFSFERCSCRIRSLCDICRI